MVPATERNSELIADLAANRPALHKSEMVGICRPSTAEDSCIFGEQRVLLAKYFVRPGGCVIARTELADLSDQPIPQLRRRFGPEYWLGSRAYFCIAPAKQRRLMLRAIQLTITQSLWWFGACRWRRQIGRVKVVLAGNAD
jgi:hypothetical protein